MSANHLTDGKTYLEIAIDAQHGGFPSRLLDVTYNCIVALYFAITPYYTESETSHDNEDGIVYIFFLEDIYCPTGNNINQAYNACIDHNSDWFSDQELFQKNHKLIDHIKKNPRIIAQQGAFILFQGEHLSSFPRYRYETVRIDKSAKAQLRNDLRLYFGIHTGSIYPEEFNLVHEMIRKSKNVSSGSFSLENELKLIFHNIEKLSEYYLDELEVASKDEYQQIIKTAEAELFDYHLRLKSFLDHLECHSYVVNALNHAGKPLTAERSFANFDYSADHVKCAKEYIIELILQYSTLVAQFAETYLKNAGSGRNTLNSNDFKIPAFYQAWCDNTQGNDQISNWLNSLMAALGGTDEKVSEPA